MESKIKKECQHEETYAFTTMSFVFTKCVKCNKILETKTNWDPTIYNQMNEQV